jgi:hypothetical protein
MLKTNGGTMVLEPNSLISYLPGRSTDADFHTKDTFLTT